MGFYCRGCENLFEENRKLEMALELAAREAVNPEGTFGEQMKRERKKKKWLREAERELRAIRKVPA